MCWKTVTIPPCSSFIISVGTETPIDIKGIIEGKKDLFLSCQICFSRGITDLSHGKAKVMVTNFSHEYRHLNKGTTVAYIDKIMEATNAFALADFAEPTPRNQALHPSFNVNPSLQKHKQEHLNALLLQYKDSL